ncbi:MAG: PilZ domain-containing protein [Epsilonproteobacteria bacterium]|nr:PilZ domain-containing protein [Campylobacterota bacterium]
MPFIIKHHKFFKEFYPKFVVSFIELLKKMHPNLKIEQEHKDFAQKAYASIFLNDEDIDIAEIYTLHEDVIKTQNINLEEIMNKLMLLMSNAFIKHILKEPNAVSILKDFVTLAEFFVDYITHDLYCKDNIVLDLPQDIINAKQKKEKIYIFSVYKGIPITHNTVIEDIKHKKVIIKVNSYQLIASKFQKEVYILLSKSNKTYRALIDSVNPAEKTITLYNIKPIKRPKIKRNFIRVQPEKETYATITYNDETYKGKIYDVSIKGIAIDLDKNLEIPPGEKVKLEFALGRYFEVDAELRSITKCDENEYRYHFQFNLHPKEEKLLDKYIISREKEIIKELQLYLKKEFIDF